MNQVTIVGGGTGTFVVTQALKKLPGIKLTKIVAVFDSGGSTARLRDEFGFLPVGDLRQSLAALAEENHQHWIRDLLLYRFDKGQGLLGHNLGNLILTALQDMSGSTPKALEIATHIFRLRGTVLPITTDSSDLQINYSDNTIKIGEHFLDDSEYGGRRITNIRLTKPCRLYSKARQVIINSDYLIFGPGDIYASIIPNLIVAGARSAFRRTTAKFIYIVNLMTRYTQTHNFTASDHVHELTKYLGRPLDYVLVNSGSIPQPILNKYAQQLEHPVLNDLTSSPSTRIISTDFASSVGVASHQADQVIRSLLRHDQTKLLNSLKKIIV